MIWPHTAFTLEGLHPTLNQMSPNFTSNTTDHPQNGQGDRHRKTKEKSSCVSSHVIVFNLVYVQKTKLNTVRIGFEI